MSNSELEIQRVLIGLVKKTNQYDIDKAPDKHQVTAIILSHTSILKQLIQDECRNAVEEYRQKLNAYWPEGSEEPTLSAKQIKQILDKLTKGGNTDD